MSKKVRLILLLVWFLAALLYHCSHSKAEETPDPALFPIPTFNPDPSSGYQDYLNLLSALPVLPTPEPSLPVAVDPPLFNQDGESTPDPFDPALTPVPSDLFNLQFTDIGFNSYIYRNINGSDLYTRADYSGAFPPGWIADPSFRRGYGYYKRDYFVYGSSAALASSSDYLYQALTLRGITGVPVGSTLTFTNFWNQMLCYYLLPSIGNEKAEDIYMTGSVMLVYSDQSREYFDFSASLVDLYLGHSYSVEVKKPISQLTVSYRMYNDSPKLADDSMTPVYFVPGPLPFYLNVTGSYTSDNSEVDAINSQTNKIGGFFKALLSGISKLFIPDEQMIQDFINERVQSIDDSPFSMAWAFTVRWLAILASPDGSPPSLTIPSYSLNINGSSYQLLQETSVDFRSLPENLLTYSRMIGDIILSLAFLKYLAGKLVMLFNIKFADTVLEIDSDYDYPSLFE